VTFGACLDCGAPAVGSAAVGKIILLTFIINCAYSIYRIENEMNPTYSTLEVARALNVAKTTLLRWLYAGKLAEPKQQTVAGVMIRVWSEKDLERAKKYREDRYYKHP
jgi:hypothetical protein